MGQSLGGANNSLGQSQNQNASQVAAFNIGDNLRVIADSLNNSILVYGSRRDYAKIEVALKQLDIPPVQVLIEASIIEVTLNDALKYGLQWAFKNSVDNQRYSGWGQLASDGGALSSTPAQGFSYVLSMGNSVRGALNLLASDSLLKVISSPSLMVMDNHEASILVGQQTPVSSSSWNTSGEVLTTNTTYKDTGVQLNVLPSVNAGDMVTLRLKQVVSEVGEIDTVSKQYKYLQREIDTQVAVRSGETLVLGGLIRDRSTEGDSGIPILKDIPLLGKLFGTTTNEGDRNELLVIITPRVVRSDEHIRQISSELRNRLKGLDHIKESNLPPNLPARLPAEQR
jgi:general secretion pathway protein D